MKRLVDYFSGQFRFHDAILVENSFEHLGFEKQRNYPSIKFQIKNNLLLTMIKLCKL